MEVILFYLLQIILLTPMFVWKKSKSQRLKLPLTSEISFWQVKQVLKKLNGRACAYLSIIIYHWAVVTDFYGFLWSALAFI